MCSRNSKDEVARHKYIFSFWNMSMAKLSSENLPMGRSHLKKTVKKGDIVPFWRPPPLNGSKGDICCLITDKSA